MEAVVRPPRTGMEAFKLMPEGTLCQLIDDALVMSPAPNIPHANAQNKIFNRLYNYVEENQLGIVFSPVVDVYLNKKNAYQPDIFFISTGNKDIIQTDGIYGAPDLVIEILSKDRNYDLKNKKAVYEQSGVKEYWVVDPETKWCQGFRLEDAKFTSLGEATGVIKLSLIDLAITF
jgi:Uma2 family endonuclease